MIILVRLDYEGDDLPNDLRKIGKIHSGIEEKIDGKIEAHTSLSMARFYTYSMLTNMNDSTREGEYFTRNCRN